MLQNLGVRFVTGVSKKHPFFVLRRIKFIYTPPNDRQPPKKDNGELVNEKVRFPQVRLIGPNGEQLGIMTSREAQFKANEYEMDLLCVAPNAQPPVCKIVNYSKYRFEQKKRAKEAKKNQHVTTLKEVQLTPRIGLHDMEVKAKNAIKFLEAGNKVKVALRFKGRELSHVEVGEETMNKFIALVSTAGQVEKAPTLDGKLLTCIIAPLKK